MSRPTLLVVEDDPGIREALAELLQEEGYAVRTAANGQEAIAAIAAGRAPDVMLLDLMMPVMDGWEVLAELERRGVPVPPTVVIVTAQGAIPEAAAGRLAAVLRKPFKTEALLAVLRRCCRPPAGA